MKPHPQPPQPVLAGRVYQDRRCYRINANLAAVGRLAEAASAGLDGHAGQIEVGLFFLHTIDRRDYTKFARQRQHLDLPLLGARIVACINQHAALSDDPALSRYGWELRDAIAAFRDGHQTAFTDLSERWTQALRLGVLL